MLKLKRREIISKNILVETDSYIVLNLVYLGISGESDWHFIKGKRSILEFRVERESGCLKDITLVVPPEKEKIIFTNTIFANDFIIENQIGSPMFFASKFKNEEVILEEEREIFLYITEEKLTIYWEYDSFSSKIIEDKISYYFNDKSQLVAFEMILGEKKKEILKNLEKITINLDSLN